MLLGFDIGGTKCAVITAERQYNGLRLVEKEIIATRFDVSPEKMISELIKIADKLLKEKSPESIGISCGGPLNSDKGIILSPPNLKGWDNVEIVKQIKTHYGVPVHLQNDANACAIAEWKFGAGKGCKNMLFLTFGTGLGAGLILNGALYSGTNDNAGEVGHIRLKKSGPVGYGKAGSFEGFCSGGGLSKMGYQLAIQQAAKGIYPAYFKNGMIESDVTAKTIADAACNGDKTAINVYRHCGEMLGQGLSVLIDILNPEKIVIGSIFSRAYNLLWKSTKKALEKETLEISLSACKIMPSELGEKIGDYAAIGVAMLEVK